MPKPTDTERAELHTHLGAAVDPPILWSIAHRQGIRLPTKDYWEFEAMVTMGSGTRNQDLDQMHDRVYRSTELIQSSRKLQHFQLNQPIVTSSDGSSPVLQTA